MLMWQG